MTAARTLLLATAVVLFCAVAGAQERGPDLAAEMAADHDALRAKFGLPPVTWDPELAQHAQAWADELVAGPGLRHSDHASRPGEGENLARIDGGRTSATDLFSRWEAEGERYHYGALDCTDPSGIAATGHYTQLIWKTTRRIGCAIGRERESEVLVCRYAPRGNICGQTPY